MPFLFAPPPQAVIPVQDERYEFFPVNRVYGAAKNYAADEKQRAAAAGFVPEPIPAVGLAHISGISRSPQKAAETSVFRTITHRRQTTATNPNEHNALRPLQCRMLQFRRSAGHKRLLGPAFFP